MDIVFEWDTDKAVINQKKHHVSFEEAQRGYMRDEYDFSNAIKNPYVAKNKQQITIRLDQQVIDYFKDMSEETGMPYQNIINYYLLQCVKEEKQMVIQFQN